jgi:hypothetical protein
MPPSRSAGNINSAMMRPPEGSTFYTMRSTTRVTGDSPFLEFFQELPVEAPKRGQTTFPRSAERAHRRFPFLGITVISVLSAILRTALCLTPALE